MPAQTKSATIFLHIPKTAGSTMLGILERLYAGQNRYAIVADSQIHALKDLPERTRSQIDLLQGHFSFGIHELLPRSSVYFTVLREPVDRVMSLYYYLRRPNGNYLYNTLTSEDVSLEAFVRRDLTPETMNFQVGALAGLNRWDDYRAINHETLERAKDNLRNEIDVFGLTERFNETLVLLNRRLHWGYASGFFLYASKNVGSDRPRRDQVPDSALAAIREKNSYDIELYEYASTLFAERVREAGLSFRLEHALQQALRSARFAGPERAHMRARICRTADLLFGYR